MNKVLTLLSAVLCVLTAMAQQSREDIRENILLSGSNYVAYYGPTQQLSTAPRGYKPYYISHYGRHGSRYLINPKEYSEPVATLAKADSLGVLTPVGQETLRKLRLISDEASGRYGELTQRGAEQHREIAHRMYERFPEVFAGHTHVDAKSTVVIRCILSMENALQELRSLNPLISVSHDASHKDMWYLNYNDKELEKLKYNGAAKEATDRFNAAHTHPERLLRTLFSDAKHIESIDGARLMDQLWKLASNLQSTELRHSITLYDLFTEEEVYDLWRKNNAGWYVTFAGSPQAGGNQPFSQRNLLRKMIEEADSCLLLPHPGATLRYGHEVCVMPLVALLDINGYGASYDDLEQLDERGWYNYRIYPMACNVQLVFYTNARPGTLPKKENILMKVLLNEDEATLPLKAVEGNCYRWTDFRDYYLSKLDNYCK